MYPAYVVLMKGRTLGNRHDTYADGRPRSDMWLMHLLLNSMTKGCQGGSLRHSMENSSCLPDNQLRSINATFPVTTELGFTTSASCTATSLARS